MKKHTAGRFTPERKRAPLESGKELPFHMGIAAGSASAFSENLATREEIEAVYQQITGKDQEERKK